MFGVASVPLSRLSGYSFGCKTSIEAVPVPPKRIGKTFARTPKAKTPTPCGLYNALCGARASMSMWYFCMSIFTCPAHCAQSTKNNKQCFAESSPMPFKSAESPLTLLTAFIAIMYVLGLISGAISSGVSMLRFFGVAIDTSITPRFSSSKIGLASELWSLHEQIICPPFCTVPKIPKFNASVQFCVKIICSGRSAFKNSQSKLRTSKTRSAVF